MLTYHAGLLEPCIHFRVFVVVSHGHLTGRQRTQRRIHVDVGTLSVPDSFNFDVSLCKPESRVRTVKSRILICNLLQQVHVIGMLIQCYGLMRVQQLSQFIPDHKIFVACLSPAVSSIRRPHDARNTPMKNDMGEPSFRYGYLGL